MHTKKAALVPQTQQSQLLKRLAHPVRLAILQILAQDEACVCHLEAALGYPQPYLSQQLAVLRDGGLISDRRDGWNVYYQLTRPETINLLDIAAELIGVPGANKPLQPTLCPCPMCNQTSPTIQISKPISSGVQK